MKRLLLALALLLLTGCAPFWSALTAASQGAQWLGSALDVAEGGADAYYARHPNQQAEQALGMAMRRARAAEAALNATLAAMASHQHGTAAGQRSEALKAYAAVRALLDAGGVLDARIPDGGSETTAPMPQPFTLPTAEELGRSL